MTAANSCPRSTSASAATDVTLGARHQALQPRGCHTPPVASRATVVPAGVIAQAWRDGSRQALLARALDHCVTVDLNDQRARAAGLLCGQTKSAGIGDASVALSAAGLASTAEVTVFTSEPSDIAHLLEALGAAARIEAV